VGLGIFLDSTTATNLPQKRKDVGESGRERGLFAGCLGLHLSSLFSLPTFGRNSKPVGRAALSIKINGIL